MPFALARLSRYGNHSKVANDDEYVLYTATVLRRVKDEFVQKCREEK